MNNYMIWFWVIIGMGLQWVLNIFLEIWRDTRPPIHQGYNYALLPERYDVILTKDSGQIIKLSDVSLSKETEEWFEFREKDGSVNSFNRSWIFNCQMTLIPRKKWDADIYKGVDKCRICGCSTTDSPYCEKCT